jgi:hypothetical protein
MRPGRVRSYRRQTDSPICSREENVMRFHRRRRTRRVAALALVACAALAAPAGAVPNDHQQPASTRIGDTPADFARPLAPAPVSGDTPVDHPGASRAPGNTAPTTVQVVRPERTIVRDVDEVVPVVLSSAALLVAVGGCAFLLVGSARRRRLGSSH